MSKYPHHLDHWLMESEWTILAIQHVKLTDKIDALIRRRQRIIKRRNLLKNLFRR